MERLSRAAMASRLRRVPGPFVDQVGLYWDDEEPAWNYAIHCDSNGKADKLDWGFDGSGDYARVD